MRTKQQGLSLIELLISITLGLVLMTGVVQMFLTSRTTYATQQAISRVQESGRLGTDFMAQDIRMAGYMGCALHNANIVDGLVPNTEPQVDFSVSIRGYVGGTGNNPLNVGEAGTDVLVVRRAGHEQLNIVEATPPSANLDVAGSATNNCLNGICVGDAAVIAGCTKGRIFRITNMTSIGGGGTRIVHSGGGVSPSNATDDLGGQEFQPGAEILKMSTITYYVAPSAFTNTRSLWQNVNGEASELVEGVDNMSLRYGVDTNNDGVPNQYQAAGDVTDWDDVLAVRIELLLRSLEDNVLAEAQPYQFAGATVTPTDRHMRQVFASTVGVRRRLD